MKPEVKSVQAEINIPLMNFLLTVMWHMIQIAKQQYNCSTEILLN
jgi:hypothetical protein